MAAKERLNTRLGNGLRTAALILADPISNIMEAEESPFILRGRTISQLSFALSDCGHRHCIRLIG
jgi:hypothetical protein